MINMLKRQTPKYIQLTLSGLILTTGLTGCGVVSEWAGNWPPGEEQDYQYPEQAAQMPVNSWSINAQNVPPNQAVPPNAGNTSPMAPPQGILTQSKLENMNAPLGTEEIRERFELMETHITAMRRDMEQIAPLLARLAVIEQSMRELSGALSHAGTGTMPSGPGSMVPADHNAISAMPHSNSYAQPANHAPAGQHMHTAQPNQAQQQMLSPHSPYGQPVAAQAAPMSVQPFPNTQATKYEPPKAPKETHKYMNNSEVKGIRFGKYKGRDRIVLDLTAPTNFRYDLDNNEKILIVDLPAAAWSGKTTKQVKSGAISSYNAQPGSNGGTQLIISLRKAAKITQARALPPNQLYGHRIFMDVE